MNATEFGTTPRLFLLTHTSDLPRPLRMLILYHCKVTRSFFTIIPYWGTIRISQWWQWLIWMSVLIRFLPTERHSIYFYCDGLNIPTLICIFPPPVLNVSWPLELHLMVPSICFELIIISLLKSLSLNERLFVVNGSFFVLSVIWNV